MPNEAAYNARHTGFTRRCSALRLFPQPYVKHFDFTVVTSTKIERQVLPLLLCPQLLLPQKSAKGPARSSHVVEQDRGAA